MEFEPLIREAQDLNSLFYIAIQRMVFGNEQTVTTADGVCGSGEAVEVGEITAVAPPRNVGFAMRPAQDGPFGLCTATKCALSHPPLVARHRST
jgi:hypothetical protein